MSVKKKWVLVFVFVAGLAAVANFVALAIRSCPSNLGVWMPALAGAALCVLAGAELRAQRVSCFLCRRPRLRRGLYASALAGAAALILLEGYLMSVPASVPQPPPQVALVLGAGLKKGQPSPVLVLRLQAALDYLTANPEAWAIVSGGQGRGEPWSEAQAMREWLIARGIEPGRITTEDRSSNTFENFKFSRALLPAGQRRVTVITSRFHMRRALMLARRVGLEPHPLPSPTPWTVTLNCHLREALAMIKSYLLDR